VYADFPTSISSFQFAIEYDTSVMTLDTLIFASNVASAFNTSYSLIEEGKIRCLVFTFGSPVTFNEETELLTMHYDIELKKQGVFPIEFGDAIGTEFTDGDNNILPFVSTNGAVILQSPFAQLQIADSLITTGLREVCLPLIADFFPTLSSFRYDLEWDPDQLNLTDVRLGNNPLGLVTDDLRLSPGRLTLGRSGNVSDSISRLPIFTELLQLCFMGNADAGGSAITFNTDSSFYLIPWLDSVRSISSILDPGGLAYRSDLADYEVGLSIGAAESMPDESTVCIPIIVNEFNQIDIFTLALNWYSPLPSGLAPQLVSIRDPHPNLEAEALNYLIHQSGYQAKIGYTPSNPGGASIPARDTLFNLCYAITDGCSTAFISPTRDNHFTRYERFSDQTYPVPHQISQGAIAMQRGLVDLRLDTFSTSDQNEVLQLNLRSLRETLPVQGNLTLNFSTDSLTLVSVTADASLTNANISFEEQPEGATISIQIGSFVANNVWLPGSWFTLTFTKDFDKGVVKVGLDKHFGRNLSAVKDNQSIRVPTVLSPGLLSVTTPTAVNGSVSLPVSVYPSPIANGQELQLEAAQLAGLTASLKLLDITGRLMNTTILHFDSTGRASSPVPGLPAGIYVLRLSTAVGDLAQKIIIKR
jgi:hypothetical protein